MRENELEIEKGDETGVNDGKRKERGTEKDIIAVNSDGKRKERGIEKDEIAMNNDGKRKERGIEKDEIAVNSDGKRRERGIEKDEIAVNNDRKWKERGIEEDDIAVNNVGQQNVSEPEKTDKGDEKENYKRKDYDSKTTCQQKVSERLITEFRKWEEQNFF